MKNISWGTEAVAKIKSNLAKKEKQSATASQVFNAFFEHLRSTAKSEHEKGYLFELAIRDYLQQSLAIAIWIKNIVVLIKALVCFSD